MTDSKPVGIVFSPWVAEASTLAEALAERLGGQGAAWVCSLTELEGQENPQPLRLLVTVGGDGTILRAIRVIAPLDVPLVGVNLGRVGFMTELSAAEALERIAGYGRGEGWIEERAMLEAQTISASLPSGHDHALIHGLNDAVVGRSGVARLIHVDVNVDGQHMATYSCDGVIIATATGSTGYALSAGGPILYPESPSFLLQPVSPQLSLSAAILLHPEALIKLTVHTNHQATLSVDGYMDVPLVSGDAVQVRRSPYIARFLRQGRRPYFPTALARRLGSPARGSETTSNL